MAEEDEIDILGDFNLDNFLTKSDSSIYSSSSLVSQNTELLNCDYTIHPQWLLDKPSANPDCWYDTNSVLSTELPEKSHESDNLGHVFTENSITDESGWTEKEKNLLERGIEIFGKSNVRLSQFIGSKTASEVKYYLKNFYIEAQATQSTFNSSVIEEITNVNNLVSDILDDTQIPASIEEVIAAVSTAKPTIQVNNNKKLRKKSSSYSNEDNEVIDLKEMSYGHSILKSNFIKMNVENYHSQTKYKTEIFNNKPKHKEKRSSTRINKLSSTNPVKQKTIKVLSEDDNNKRMEFISKVEITTGKGLAVPICEGEEIIKIQKEDSDKDSDTDIEIDVEDSNDFVFEPKIPHQNRSDNSSVVEESKTESIIEKDPVNVSKQIKQYIDLTILEDTLVQELMNLEKPQTEIVINEKDISELEKVVHSEFFEGRPTKTPMRYLKIRNHILNTWSSMKPSYVTKTSIRHGLKNCGDVNCISRIHSYLEQIGAINFGCSQTNYIRPLYEVFQTNTAVSKEKNITKEIKNQLRGESNELGFRSRIKRKFINDGEGGYTLTHDEKGEVINTTIVNEEPVKQKSCIKKPVIRLIYCRSFSKDNPQRYTIKLHLSTLLLMDFHAHTSLMEVMGLVAGEWNSLKNILIISHYEPCCNVASSSTHCDMCPISQAKAADTIHDKGLNILGWFHSHPTFAPEPSQQDLDTQQMFQLWIGNKNPCISLILSPFSSNGALIASPYRCMIVDRKENFYDQYVPYKFNVELIAEDFDIDYLLKNISKIFNSNSLDSKESRVDFNQSYFLDTSINYLEKFITSVRMHLAKCGNINKMTCDLIVQSIINICNLDK